MKDWREYFELAKEESFMQEMDLEEQVGGGESIMMRFGCGTP